MEAIERIFRDDSFKPEQDFTPLILSAMKKTILAFAIVLTSLFPAAVPACAEEQPSPVKILSIGNSFSVNAHHYLAKICETSGKPVVLGNAMIGGCTMERHWKNASTNGVCYRYKNQAMTLAQMLEAEKWQYVTIQQASWYSQNPATYEPFGTRLMEFIRTHAPQAEIVLHETWAYRGDEKRIAKAGLTPYEMYAKIEKAYKQFAAAHNLRTIPAGWAFKTAWDTPEWGLRVVADQKTGAPAKGKPLHRKDGYHANAFGEYLLGLVWAKTLLDIDPGEVTYVPKDVGETYANLLKKIASAAVSTYQGAETH